MDGNSIPRSHSTRSTTEYVNSIQDIYASNLKKKKEDAIKKNFHIIYHYVEDFNRIHAIHG